MEASVLIYRQHRLRSFVRGPEHPFSPHLRSFSRKSLRTTIEGMGFQIISLDKNNQTLHVLAVR